jgi:hypothetical protein
MRNTEIPTRVTRTIIDERCSDDVLNLRFILLHSCDEGINIWFEFKVELLLGILDRKGGI